MNAANTIQAKVHNPDVVVLRTRDHAKASESYVDVRFAYAGGTSWLGSVPYKYRRTGLDLPDDDYDGIALLVEAAYAAMSPDARAAWLADEVAFWATKSAAVTKQYFDALSDNEWKCEGHEFPSNPNFARRIQDLKEMGYTLAYERRACPVCDQTKSHQVMLALPRVGGGGYETIGQALRKRIIATLGSYDAYEARAATHLLPDHKFPEIRWDSDTLDANAESMSAAAIQQKFQLLSNQRNQQKREVCRRCFQTGKRGYPYGVKYFYSGDAGWTAEVPRSGKSAEPGCVGCGWYDLEAWRKGLNAEIVDF